MEAARRLYGRHNYNNVRIADIAEASSTNVALVNYYFGSKDDLFLEIFREACEVVSQERVQRLEALLALDETPTLERLVQAWMEPVVAQIHREGNRLIFSHLLSLVFASVVNESMHLILREAFQRVDVRYAEVIHRLRPELSMEVLAWRMLGAIGTFSVILGHPELITLVRDEPLREWSAEIDVQAELLRCLVAQLGAPAPQVETKRPSRRTCR